MDLVTGLSNSAYDLAIFGDQLYLPDFRNNHVNIYHLPDGKIESKIDARMPHGIATDSGNAVYVCTHRENSLFVFDGQSGSYLQSPYFDHPVSISIDKERFLIANYGANDTGSIIFSDNQLRSFKLFTRNWAHAKPHSIRITKRFGVAVAYRDPPGIVMFDNKGNVVNGINFSSDFDPLSAVEYRSLLIVPNYYDGNLVCFNRNLNPVMRLSVGDFLPTNLAIWRDNLIVTEERANRVLIIPFRDFYGNHESG